MGKLTVNGTVENFKVVCINDDKTFFRIPGKKYHDDYWGISKGDVYEVVERYFKNRYDADGKFFDLIEIYLLKEPVREISFTDSKTGEVVPFGFHASRFLRVCN